MSKGRNTIPIASRQWVHLILPCALLALVAVLAALQYRWVGQIADAERQRMRAGAQARAAQFAEEFDGELTRLSLVFAQVPAPPPAAAPSAARFSGSFPSTVADDRVEDAAQRCAEEYARWLANTTHPALIRGLYIVRDAEGAEGIRKLTNGRFEPAAWPGDLADLRSRLPKNGNMKTPGFRLLASDVPALVLPLTRFQVSDVGSDGRRVRIMNVVGVSGIVIVQLDGDYIRHQWLPLLARRYFGGAGGFDYNVSVVRGDAVLYASDPALPKDAFAKPDVIETLFQVRPDQMQRLVVSPVAGKAALALDTMRFTFDVRRDASKGGARQPDQGSGAWQLRLVHRAGSLDAAVAQSRRRNLAISFGILALLGASLGLIVLSTRRAARLARQQVEFVAGVTHELRTPLSVICSAAENLTDGVVSDGGQVRRYGALIAGEGRRLTEMIEQVMTFAGLESGRAVGGRQVVAVEEIVAHALEASATAVEQRGVSVETHVTPDLPPVEVNAAAIERSVRNLIDNAIKYGNGSSWLRVSARMDPDAADTVAISVEDRGPGIAPDEQRRIFEPFYRGRDVLASPVRGSGLGLSLVKRIVEAHGGALTLTSAPGKGSAFVIHLPAAALPEKERPS